MKVVFTIAGVAIIVLAIILFVIRIKRINDESK